MRVDLGASHTTRWPIQPPTAPLRQARSILIRRNYGSLCTGPIIGRLVPVGATSSNISRLLALATNCKPERVLTPSLTIHLGCQPTPILSFPPRHAENTWTSNQCRCNLTLHVCGPRVRFAIPEDLGTPYPHYHTEPESRSPIRTKRSAPDPNCRF